MRKTLQSWHGWLFAVAVALCLSACGSSSPSGAAAKLLHRKPATPAPKRLAAVDPTADMSTAVSAGNASSPVSVKFQLSGRPQPGQPLSVDFALIPSAGVVALAAKFEADDGLAVVDGGEVAELTKPAQNVPIHHSVTVLPKADGIYTMRTILTVTTDADPRQRVFSVPIIAGKGLPQLASHTDRATPHP
jgi:hypothetical protein